MILCFITRNIYLVFIPVSGTDLPKVLEFPKCWEWYKVTLREHMDRGWLPMKPTMWLKGLELSVWPLREGQGLGVQSITNVQWCNQSCLCNESSITTQKHRVEKDSRLVNIRRFGESDMPSEGMEAPCSFPTCCPVYLSIPELQPFIRNEWLVWKTFLRVM